MSNVLATIPVHFALQLVIAGNQSLENGIPYMPLPQPQPQLQPQPPPQRQTQPHLQPQPEPVLPEGYTAFPDIGVALKYYPNRLTWNSARKYCINEGGNLAVVDSIDKSRRVDSVRKSQPLAGFLGIHKLFGNSEWVSVTTGLPLDSIPWYMGSDLNSSELSCTVLWGADGGRVGPLNCDEATAYTCEIQMPNYKTGVQPTSPTGTIEQIKPIYTEDFDLY